MLENNKENTELYQKYIDSKDVRYIDDLYNNVYPYLYNMTHKYIHSKDMTDDLIHNAFQSIIEKSHTYKEGKDFNPWFLTIIFNQIIHFNRKEKRYTSIIETYEDKDDEDSLWKFSSAGKDLASHLQESAYENEQHVMESLLHEDSVKINRLVKSFLSRSLQFQSEEIQNMVQTYYFDNLRVDEFNELFGGGKYAVMLYNLSAKKKFKKHLSKNFPMTIHLIEQETGIKFNY